MQVCACEHTKRVYIDSLHSWLNVPCGHCDACLASKGFHRSERLGQSMAMYTHKYFVTLTFSDEYLPVAYYNEVTESFVSSYDCDYNGVPYAVDGVIVSRDFDKNEVLRFVLDKYKGLPVLSRRIAINFKKRLRKEFSKYYEKEYLFIYIVGEYGSKCTYRPHYHCVLCTNAPVESSVLELCVHKAWSHYDKVKQDYISEYGRIDFQRIVSKGIRNYVAQYVNCTSNLPSCLSSGDFRPFYQSSPLVNADCVRFKNVSLSELFDACTPESTCISLIDNSSSTELLPNFITFRYFPKCFKYCELAFSDRVQFYSVFESVSSFTAKEFADMMLNSFFGGIDAINLCRSLLVDSDVNASYRRLIRHFYLSRRVCLNASRLGVSLECYVARIDLFWSRYELLKLRRFYELQLNLLEDKFNPVGLDKLFTLYYDTPDDIKHLSMYCEQFGIFSRFAGKSVSVSSIPSFTNFHNLMHKIILDTRKTRIRNDFFDSKGYRRPSFISKFKFKKSCLVFSRI